MRTNQATLQAYQTRYDNMLPDEDALTHCILCGAIFDGARWDSDICEECHLEMQSEDYPFILTNID